MPAVVDGKAQLAGPDGRPIPPDTPGLPHVYTFAGLYNTTTRMYSWRWDEAYTRSREDAIGMRLDASIMGMLRERQMPIEQCSWHLDPEDAKDKEQKECADYLAKVIQATPCFEDYLRHLQEALWYGRGGAQQVWGKAMVGGEEALAVVDHYPTNGDKIQFTWDGIPSVMIYAGEREKLEEQGATITYADRGPVLVLDKPYWRQRWAIHKGDIIDADFFEIERAGGVHGVGLRHWCYWHWWLKQELLSWCMDFWERTGLGLTVFFYEEGNAASKAAAMQAAKDAGRNTVLVVPRSVQTANAGSGVERVETDTTGSEYILRVMEYFDGKLERLIVGQTLSSDSEGSGLGGTGVAKLHGDTKHQILKHDATRLGSTLTRDLVKPVQRWNAPEAAYNLRWVFDLTDPNAGEKLEAAKKVFDMGVKLKTDEVRGLAGLSKPEEDDEVLEQQDPTDWHRAIREGDSGSPMKPEGGKYSPFGEVSRPRPPVDAGGRGRRVDPERYEKGQWITIGGRQEGDKKHVGGTPVYVENGRITKGHPSLTGKRINALSEPAEEAGGHRKQLKDSAEYNRVVWGNKARAEGLDHVGLHQLAAEMMAHDNAAKNEHHSLLARAHSLHAGLGHGSLKTVAARASHGQEDWQSIKGIDDTASALAEEFPGFSGDPEHLYNLLVAGKSAHMTEDEAYEAAYEHLQGMQAPRDRIHAHLKANAGEKGLSRKQLEKATGMSGEDVTQALMELQEAGKLDSGHHRGQVTYLPKKGAGKAEKPKPAEESGKVSRDAMKQAILERVQEHGGFDLIDVQSWFPDHDHAEVNAAVQEVWRENRDKLHMTEVSDGRDFSGEEHKRLPVAVSGLKIGHIGTHESTSHYRSRGQRAAGVPELPPVGQEEAPKPQATWQEGLPGFGVEATDEATDVASQGSLFDSSGGPDHGVKLLGPEKRKDLEGQGDMFGGEGSSGESKQDTEDINKLVSDMAEWEDSQPEPENTQEAARKKVASWRAVPVGASVVGFGGKFKGMKGTVIRSRYTTSRGDNKVRNGVKWENGRIDAEPDIRFIEPLDAKHSWRRSPSRDDDPAPFEREARPALERVRDWREPDLFTEPGRCQQEMAAFERLPDGCRVVSLCPETYGKLGTVEQVNGVNVLRLDDGQASGVWAEPLDASLSWRAAS